MSQMTVRYFIDLASNIGQRARQDAQQLEEAQRRMGGAVTRTQDRVAGLARQVGNIITPGTAQRQIDYFERIARSIDKAKVNAANLKQTLANGFDNLPEIAAGAAAGYYIGKGVMAAPVRAYADLETATVDLKVALTNSAGKVDKSFTKIAAEAERLGQKLPGSTKDFMAGARTLIEQGMSGDQVAGGGLAAASNFGVLMGMDSASAAKTIAKTREAFGLSANDFGYAADYMQRARYGFGIDPQDFLAVGSYAAPTYNAMGLTGKDNFRKLLAVQGMAASVGLEASSFGTNFSQMLGRLAEVNPKLGGNREKSKEMAAILSGSGVDMNFYDQKGEFGGIENMLKELSKLRALSTVDRQRVLTNLFGQEAGRPAMILAEKGLDEYRMALAKMDNQADIDSRITMKMDTFAAKLEALGGTIEGVMAKLASPIGQASKPVIDQLNDAAGGFGEWVENNPISSGIGLASAAGVASVLGIRRARGLTKTIKGLLSGGTTAAAPVVAAASKAKPIAPTKLDAEPGSRSLKTITAEQRAIQHNAAQNRGLGASLEGQQLERQMKRARLANSVAGGAMRGFRALPWLGLAYDSYGVLSDDELTGAGKVRGMGAVASSAVGAWGGGLVGAKAGAVLGTMILPGAGTVVGGVLGGIAGGVGGYMGGEKAFNSAFAPDAKRDYIAVTAPGGNPLAKATMGQETTLKIGEGKLQVDVRVTDQRVSATTTVSQQPSLVRINAGSTNPGGF